MDFYQNVTCLLQCLFQRSQEGKKVFMQYRHNAWSSLETQRQQMTKRCICSVTRFSPNKKQTFTFSLHFWSALPLSTKNWRISGKLSPKPEWRALKKCSTKILRILLISSKFLTFFGGFCYLIFMTRRFSPDTTEICKLQDFFPKNTIFNAQLNIFF